MDVQKTTKLMLIRNYFSDTVKQVTFRVGNNNHMLTTVSGKTIYFKLTLNYIKAPMCRM